MVASVELQKAIFKKLSERYDVFEVKKPNHPKPYIQIGEEDLDTVDTKTHERSLHNVTLITYSKGTSSITHKEMNDFVVQSMVRGKLDVEGFNVDLQEMGLSSTTREDKTETTEFRTVMTFDITLTRR